MMRPSDFDGKCNLPLTSSSIILSRLTLHPFCGGGYPLYGYTSSVLVEVKFSSLYLPTLSSYLKKETGIFFRYVHDKKDLIYTLMSLKKKIVS